MAMRSIVSRSRIHCFMEGNWVNWRSSATTLRRFTDDKGRVLSEEERAKETVYIQKMERERLEKKKKKEELEKAQKEKAEKAGEGAQKS